ncbi:hypothetical protein AMES_2045 [Amycolatopsis mediterranei S699]|uniref:Uncharacterized protein n=2 Tax=Amycolatopsis mediterranei TaxID=33910 RepID=A0A0H3CZU3_AMYMU|nr:hypothetical protein [Amycolatopsis mediterranei]ADJ43868.1 hypothetical protein AMED_2061 [Amycolatopsis mediterranei U32]AEK40583.1 hypothetical protein RAM_10465 [Amycolatopsis mediterranei S699]AFO75581.1 hypothetical protein AMES_2045 [Amycolatopsis mediterranei S699]AGT82710.1 hypothetical protein B737_2046 [Amycolatopsis mediterranei RB]KDO09125.1 hypothetical protein DV26_19370 [Amycolatopsis mediterranei]
MDERAAFTDFPIEIRRRAASYLGVTSRAEIPEVSRIGSEGTESSENTESSEGKEGTEGSESTERSEMTETSENTETSESAERYAGRFR